MGHVDIDRHHARLRTHHPTPVTSPYHPSRRYSSKLELQAFPPFKVSTSRPSSTAPDRPHHTYRRARRVTSANFEATKLKLLPLRSYRGEQPTATLRINHRRAPTNNITLNNNVERRIRNPSGDYHHLRKLPIAHPSSRPLLGFLPTYTHTTLYT